MPATQQDLTDAIKQIQATMEEAEPENLDYRLMDYLAACLRKTADRDAAVAWAKGFDAYLQAA